jgi:ABC-type multidrug transport system fused ATPase/permease subunit
MRIPDGKKFMDGSPQAFVAVAVLLILFAATAQAIPLSTYHREIKQAVTALDTLAQTDETETPEDYTRREGETIAAVRQLLPRTETVDWEGTEVSVDNSWLHQQLDHFGKDHGPERTEILRRIKERLQAIDERITEVVTPGESVATNKAENNQRLREILARPEYVQTIKQPNAITRILQQFIKWIESLFPKPRSLSPGIADIFSKIAQIVVIGLSLAVLAFVAKLFLPKLLQSRGKNKKKAKGQARIVMGEKLEPDQTAVDLLAEAEGLARQGELRAAIRKAYIALLLELGDRKIISLAQYKTNHDYLRAVRSIEYLYGNVKVLTDSFELHWYGLAQTTETDWLAFRSAYQQALLK